MERQYSSKPYKYLDPRGGAISTNHFHISRDNHTCLFCFVNHRVFNLLFVSSLDVVGGSRVQDRDPEIHVDLLPHCPRLNLQQTKVPIRKTMLLLCSEDDI